MDKCIEQWDTQALTHTTRLMLRSVCATLPDTAAYERVIIVILWVLLPGYVGGGQSAATVGFSVFRNCFVCTGYRALSESVCVCVCVSVFGCVVYMCVVCGVYVCGV